MRHIDLQRITLGNIQRAPQLYGQDDASQLIHLSDDTGCFHSDLPFFAPQF